MPMTPPIPDPALTRRKSLSPEPPLLQEGASAALLCLSCGARATTWLVQLDGETVAAADRSEAYLRPALLTELLGVLGATDPRAGGAA